MLVVVLYLVVLLLLVLLHRDNHLPVVGHGEVCPLGSVGRHLDGREDFLYLGFHLVHVNVAHDDDALLVGAVPLLIVVAQCLVGEVVHDLHRPYRQAVSIFAARVYLGERLLVHPHNRPHVGAPLLMDDTALLVDFLRVKRQPVRPVVQDEQARVDDRLADNGHI